MAPGSLRRLALGSSTVGLIVGCRPAGESQPATSAPAVTVESLLVPRGTPLGEVGGTEIQNGGFGSGLAVDPRDSTVFYLLTDRGPNTPIRCGRRELVAIAVPRYSPRIGRFRRVGDTLRLDRIISLARADGTPLTGLPQPNREPDRTETATDVDCNPLAPDSLGLDSEGLALAADGSFWVSDEYGPDIVHFGPDGRMIERFAPGAGLPRVLARRRLNRGMEGVTLLPDGRTVAGLLQSALDNPTAGDSSAGRRSRLTRLVVFEPGGRARQYGYLIDSPKTFTSDIVALSDTSFLVLEHDATFQATGPAVKRVYRFDIAGATDLSDPTDDPCGLLVDGQTLEQLTADAAHPDSVLATKGIRVGVKSLVLDLVRAVPEYPHNKIEGLTVVNDRTIAISNDDDFGVTDGGTCRFQTKHLTGTNRQEFF
jgi:hypothetical protein